MTRCQKCQFPRGALRAELYQVPGKQLRVIIRQDKAHSTDLAWDECAGFGRYLLSVPKKQCRE